MHMHAPYTPCKMLPHMTSRESVSARRIVGNFLASPAGLAPFGLFGTIPATRVAEPHAEATLYLASNS